MYRRKNETVVIADLLPWIQTEILPLSDQAPFAARDEGATCLQVSDSAHDASSDRGLADQFVVLGAEVGDGAVDVWVLLVAGYGIGVLGTLPGVCILDEAEAGQDDQEDCNEALHRFGKLGCCHGRVLQIRKSWKGNLDGQVLGDEVATA